MSIYEFLERLENEPFDQTLLEVFLPKEKNLSEFGFFDFRREINRAAKRNANNFYFTQTRDAYYADYRPAYPKRTTADFTVCLLFGSSAPRLSMYQGTACVPTIKQYHTMSELLYDLSKMEENA